MPLKPVRLPAAATAALPRWGLWALGLLYILSGLIGRTPWKNEDATGFGISWTMAHGNLADWLMPNVAGLPVAGESPLAYWLGAGMIRLFGSLTGDDLAARLGLILTFLIGSMSVWYATYLLGRRAEAQPMKLAFGGQPEPRDYGRTLADGAFLIYLGSIGLLAHSHQTTAKNLQISLVALALLATVRLFEEQRIRHAALLGTVLGLLTLTRGWELPLALFAGLVITALWQPLRTIPAALARLVGITLPLAILVGAAWLVAVWHWIPGSDGLAFIQRWQDINAGRLAWFSVISLAYIIKNGIWFVWPSWPYAGWTLYAWRSQLKALHIRVPLTFFLSTLILLLLNNHPDEGTLLPLLPPLVILAAFGLPTIKRGAINAIDWFAVIMLTFCAAFIWLGWIAKETSWPAWLTRNIYKLVPGFKPGFEAVALVVALLSTIAWIVLLRWRLSRQPPVLWRAVVLSSGGVILCWLLLMTLWLPWIDYSKSYVGVARQIAVQLPKHYDCVSSNVGAPQRASFAYFGQVQFAAPENGHCDYLLFQDNNELGLESVVHRYPGNWALLWTGRRPADRDERFRLYRREPDAYGKTGKPERPLHHSADKVRTRMPASVSSVSPATGTADVTATSPLTGERASP